MADGKGWFSNLKKIKYFNLSLVNVKFMINIRITYCREFDGFDSEGVLIKKISYKGKEIALIFYNIFEYLKQTN